MACPDALVVSYREVLEGSVHLADVLREGDVLRIESAGKDFETYRSLLAFGASELGARITAEQALRLEVERGRILLPRQWYLGLRRFLRTVDDQCVSAPRHDAMNAISDIEVMFDKPRCHAHLSGLAIPCPRALPSVGGYLDLRHAMRELGLARVFLKLAHGSSASGVVAFETAGRRQQAITTVEMIGLDEEPQHPRLYNSRRIHRYIGEREIAALIDQLALEGVHVEQWVPKAGFEGYAFDLRVLVIAGSAKHIVVRMSRSPFTNLHLGNRRGSVERLRLRMGDKAWESALHSCERAAGAFPNSLYVGVDLLVAPGFRRHAVLEVNAFGDLLPGVLYRGRDTYSAELRALLERGRGSLS
jgi:hypothetical protein